MAVKEMYKDYRDGQRDHKFQVIIQSCIDHLSCGNKDTDKILPFYFDYQDLKKKKKRKKKICFVWLQDSNVNNSVNIANYTLHSH